MPSMHAGYSIWCSLSMLAHSPFAIFKVLAYIYPLLTLYCIVVTGNHYFLDAVFGAVCWYVADKVADHLPKVGRGSIASEGLLQMPAGPPSEEELGTDEEAMLMPVTVADLGGPIAGASLRSHNGSRENLQLLADLNNNLKKR